jgi:RimJ/RimL family protein N-acetyltransferase
MLRLTGKPWFRVGGFFDGGRLIALAMAEKIGDTLIIHIEKALYSYNGIYPALVQTFAQTFGEDVKYFNREDDAADRGLRASKLQYGPAMLGAKFCFEPQNEVQHYLTEVPALETDRLTLNAITEEDIPAYNKLVLDKERNRWWGYDDVGGLKGPVQADSFYRVAEEDFRNRLAVNFAVRLDGRFIGEAVLYRFNCRGEAELGCRILPEFAGYGYGTEAFAAAAEWALYKLHLTRLVAKCYHENKASFQMLSSCMRKSGSDETFDYFEKLL